MYRVQWIGFHATSDTDNSHAEVPEVEPRIMRMTGPRLLADLRGNSHSHSRPKTQELHQEFPQADLITQAHTPESAAIEMEQFWKSITPYFATQPFDIGLYRIVMEECSSLASEPTDVTYEEVNCPGTVRPAIWCKPALASPSRAILYLHGGAFIACSPASHRKLAAHLAKKTGAYALLVDYRRAPEHQFPCQIEDVVSAYKWLLNNRGISNRSICLAGDSAGGNLTVSVSLALRNQGIPMPAAIAAFSAWLDMRVAGESYKRNAGKDILADPDTLPGVIAAYLGGAPLDDPLVDVLRADLKGLPPMYLTAGTAEVLESDAVTLARRAREAGIDVQLELPSDLQHIWICLAGNAAEADTTLSQAAAFLRKRME